MATTEVAKTTPTYNLQSFNRAITSQNTSKYLTDVLGERKGSFVNNLTALVANNVNLQSCEPYTVMFAAMKATALDLPLDNALGFAYVIPYKNNARGISVAQFQIGYKGIKQLAMRTNQFEVINATDVKSGELLKRNRLTGEITFNFIEDDEEREKLETIGYVSYFRLKNGFESTFYMSKSQVETHAKRYSQSYRSTNRNVKDASPWSTDWLTMALKTVTKLNLSKNAPLSVEMRDAIKSDQAVFRSQEMKPEYDDNMGGGQAAFVDAQKAIEVAEIFKEAENAGNENKE